MSKLISWMDERLYPGVKSNWDDELFRVQILRHIGPSTRVLDFGAGRGNVAQMNFRGIAGHVAGIDLERAVFENPFLDEAALIDAGTGRIPFSDSSFDVVFADNVMEHVEDPVIALREIFRVLKPGGRFLAKTPNRWHYMPIVARITPTLFHRFYNRKRGREVFDTFPTRYRCNTAGAVERHAASAGLVPESVQFAEGRPEYLRVAAIAYLFGFFYERLVNSFSVLAPIRCVIIFELVRLKAPAIELIDTSR